MCYRGNPSSASPTRSRATCRTVLGSFVLVAVSLVFAGRAALADDAAMLVAPRELPAGGRSSFTLTTFDAATRGPVDRAVVVRLVGSDASATTIHEGRSGPYGRVNVPFDVPALGSGSYTMEAEIEGQDEPISLDTRITRAPAILIETDKPIYKPSQTIVGRVLLVDNALRPVSGAVELVFHDAKGIRIDRRPLVTNEFGVAPFSLDLASELNLGTWKLRARSEDVESVRDVRVEKYTLPRYELELGFSRSWALVDEEIPGTLTARYFFGKDVEGTAIIRASRWIGQWSEYARIEGVLSGGELEFTLPAVEFVAGSPAEGGQGAVSVDVEVTDSTGHTQSTSELLTITEASVVLGLVPRARSLGAGVPFAVLITASSPDGTALDASVHAATTFYGLWGEIVEKRSDEVDVVAGAGTLVLTPPADTTYAQLIASTERDGRRTSTEARIGGAYSESGSFLSIARDGPDTPAAIGEIVGFSAVSTHPGTLYYEVYAGGRTVLSDAVESDEFSFAVSPEMIPRAKVVAYRINPDNEVAADSTSIEVEIAGSINVQASFDRDEAKPGEDIDVTLDAGTGERTLLGVSIVDESVLALGRSRLHLAELFAELERRFLEPQVEVHEAEDDPIDVPRVDAFFGTPRSFGALDIFEDAGLAVASSRNVTVPEGGVLDWALERFDDNVGPPAPAGGAEATPEGVRIRQYFPETWVWEPLLVTDEDGRATLSLTVPDSVTGWKLGVVGSSARGIGFGESELVAFQNFFVEPSLPYAVTRGEEFPIKVDIFNYVDDAQEVAIRLGDPGWYEILGEAELSITVPAGSATSVQLPIRPIAVGEHEVEITAIGSQLSDAVRRTLLVEPEGVPVEQISNGVIEAGQTLPLDVSFPTSAIPDSERAFLHITPSPVAQTLNGVSDLLGMPYGCGEQNMIFLAPDIEILKYLREIGELQPEVRAEAEYFVNVGYQRQLTFRSDDGGFSAFGGPDGSLWLTAFVLSTFSGARDVRDIDEGVLEDAADMLVSRRRIDGSFQPDDFLIHKEMDGGLENLFALTAYVLNALVEYTEGGQASGEVTETIERAATYLANLQSEVNDDAYSLSIAAVALEKIAGFEDSAGAIIERLLELAIDDGVGIHWEPYPVETTGYAALALLAADGGAERPEAGAAIDWLSTQRNALGGYGGSTQDTVVAIRALFQAARHVRRDLDIDLALGKENESIWTLHVDETNFDLLHSVEIALPAANVELAATGDGSVGYQVVRRYHVPGEELPPSRDMTITVEYDSEGIEVDDILDVLVRLEYGGFKEKTGMVIADVGVPTGFEALGDSLDAAVDSGAASRVELAGRKVIFYIDSLTQGVPHEIRFAMRALWPVRAEGPVSRAYEYYDAEVEGFDRGAPVTVREPFEPSFIRGDANGDEAVDLSDAVATLSFLFQGVTPPPVVCDDAADTNDDGQLNITDAIYLLVHLYLGGPGPSAPYPDPGSDPTADGLGCGVSGR